MNPKVLEILKLSIRSYSLWELEVVKKNGKRYCKWCGIKETRTPRSHYCGKECQRTAYIMFNPQKDCALFIFLKNQNFKCNSCSFDYNNVLDQDLSEGSFLVKDLKDKLREINENRLPEVDHIVPIALGGLGLGQDNHQVLCKMCHKEKTKVDHKKIREYKLK